MYLIILVILITELTTVSSGEDNYCMSDCNSQRQPSLYEQHCCNLTNIGNTIKFKDGKLRTFIICPSNLPNSCFQFYNYSCLQIHQVFPSATSGYYNITLTNRNIATVYCDMEGINCDEEGGWTRVANLNMTEPGTTCPSGLTQTGYININHDVCGQPNPSSGGCDSTFFSTYSLNYTKICGKVRGYQFNSPDAFFVGIDIDSYYVDGVSITYGNNPRQHIWTYAAGLTETFIDSVHCPCNNGSAASTPSFVGNDYYCESGLNVAPWTSILYADDPLWDGKNCNGLESTCCTNPNIPWFLKTLDETITDNIELRVCNDQSLPDEGTPLDIIEIYVK